MSELGRYRSSITGRFKAAKAALQHPNTSVREPRDDPARDWARQAYVFLGHAMFADDQVGEQYRRRADELLASAPRGVRL